MNILISDKLHLFDVFSQADLSAVFIHNSLAA